MLKKNRNKSKSSMFYLIHHVFIASILLFDSCDSNTYVSKHEVITVSDSLSVKCDLPETFKEKTIGVSKWGVDAAKTYVDSIDGSMLEFVFFNTIVTDEKNIEQNAKKAFEVLMPLGYIEQYKKVENDYFTGYLLIAHRDTNQLFVYVGQNNSLKLSIRLVLRGKGIHSNYFSKILNSLSIKYE